MTWYIPNGNAPERVSGGSAAAATCLQLCSLKFEPLEIFLTDHLAMDEDGSGFSGMDPTTVAVLKGNVNLLLSVFAC